MATFEFPMRDVPQPVVDDVNRLDGWLALWKGRDHPSGVPSPAVARKAGDKAVETVDRLLAELQSLRSRLVDEVRRWDND